MAHICVNLPRADRPHKLSDCARRRLVREATKTPMATLKELTSSAGEIGETGETQQLLPWFFTSQSFMGEWQRESHWWRKLIKSSRGHPKTCGRLQGQLEEGFFGLMRPKWSFQTRCCVWRIQTTAVTANRPSPHEAWWWQHHAVGMRVSSRRLVKVEGKMNSGKYRDILKESIHQKLNGNCFKTARWMLKSGWIEAQTST